MAATNVVRRSLLYVPASSSKFLEKSRSLAVDHVSYDLEDSVTPGKKAEARVALRKFLEQPRPEGVREIGVRINSVDTGFALDDLTEVVCRLLQSSDFRQRLKAPNLDAITVPKVNSAADLHFVTDVIRHTLPSRHPSSPPSSSNTSSSSSSAQPPLKIIALIESAKSLISLPSICAASPYLSGLVFAAEDFALDLSLTRTPSLREFLYARSAIVTAARAFNLPSAIDLVCTHFRGDEALKALEEECEGGKRLGFNGKQLIHPSQVEVCQRVYSPSEKEVEWAVRVVVADEKADRGGRGAWTLDGKMIDKPVVGKAKGIVAKAEACGMDLDAIREKWKDQEPE